GSPHPMMEKSKTEKPAPSRNEIFSILFTRLSEDLEMMPIGHRCATRVISWFFTCLWWVVPLTCRSCTSQRHPPPPRAGNLPLVSDALTRDRIKHQLRLNECGMLSLTVAIHRLR
ncbi:hypothetical protein L9F63_000507, partial [Diploptera punctata]